MRFLGILARAAVADVRASDDQRRPLGVVLRLGDRPLDCIEVVDVGDVEHLPAVRFEPLGRVVGERELGLAVDGDVIVVVEPDQLPELEVSGERRRLVRDPLHEIAVATDEERVVVDDFLSGLVERGGEVGFGDGHADGVARSLAERAGGRLDSGRVAMLGVPGRLASPLAKLLEILEGEVVPGQVEARVQQHRRVAAGENEPIAVGPRGIGRVEAHRAREQHVAERRQRHRRAGVSGVGLLHGVHGQRADGIDAEEVEGGRGHRGSGRFWMNGRAEVSSPWLPGENRRYFPAMRATEAAGGVPEHERIVFTEKRHRYCVAVFVINEGERVRTQLAAMARFADTIDIVVADGGSTDGSLAPDSLADFRLRALLVKRGPGRLSAQMRMAIGFALEEGYDGMVVIDGNGKDDLDALPRMIELLDAGYDHVQGSRYIAGGSGINTPPSRTWAVKLVHAPMISLAAGTRYTDTTNGFRAYSRRLLSDPRVAPLRDVFMGYELHYYLAIRAARLGFRVIETPVTRRYPASGKTPTKISPVKGNLRVLRTLVAAVLGRFDP